MDTLAKINLIPYWYHRIELPDGIVTPGGMPFAPEVYRLPDFTGKRVLDVGSWDGYFTWEALKGGASEVIAIDDFSDMMGADKIKDAAQGMRPWQTWDICREALGFTNCDRINMSVYDVSPERMGLFDIILFYGVLYHCRYPLLALDKLSAVCAGEIRVETAICDDYSPHRGGRLNGYPTEEHHCLAEFFAGAEYGNNHTNWWAPNCKCLKGMMEAAGFTDIRLWKYSEQKDLTMCRGFAAGRKG